MARNLFIPLGLGLVLLNLAAGPARAQTGITPADPGSIQRAIDAAAAKNLPKIVIPPGIYRLSADHGARAHLFFSQLKNFEIDATGVTFILTTPGKGGIRFEGCRDVTLRGATLIHDPIPFSQGKITAIAADNRTCDIQVDQGYPDPTGPGYGLKKTGLNLYRAANRQWLDDTYAGNGGVPQRLGPHLFRLEVGRPFDPRLGWVVGAAVAWRGPGNPDIELRDCAGMKIIGETIKNGAGFCIFENGGDGGNYYSYTVTYGPKPAGAIDEPLMASNADGFHSNGVRHGPTLENCHFEGMNDDGIPIHGQYGFVQETQGARITVEVRNVSFCRPGDRLRFADNRGVVVGDALVVATEPAPGYRPVHPAPADLRLYQDPAKNSFVTFTLDRPIAAQFGWQVANTNANGDGFVIRNCTVRNNRARGMLIKASDGLIENCTVDGSSMGGIVLSPEMGTWSESDYSRNVVIRHNTIRHVDYAARGAAQVGALTVAAYEHQQFVPLPGGHRNITIEDNTFDGDDGINLLITSADGVVVRDNHFVHPMTNPSDRALSIRIDPGALVYLTQCTNVSLSGNLVTQPGPYLKKTVEASATASGTGFTNGVTVQP
jgi:hypothetical protein